MNDFDSPNPLFRVDLLTGCYNLVSFSKDLEDNFHNEKLKAVSLVVVDVYQLRQVNQTKGFHHGDKVLRWLGIAIKDVTASNVYRISGDNFVAVMIGGTQKARQAKARNLFERLNSEAGQLELTPPVVRMAVIHFPKGATLNPAVVWRNINEKMPELSDGVKTATAYQAVEADVSEKDKATLKAIRLMAGRIENLGGALQYTFRLAYTDPISGAPNTLAIQRRLELELSDAILENRHMCVCLIDGDDLKRYNANGYEAGDDAICKIHNALVGALRPGDFIGRWRMGDEFVIILPRTNIEQAGMVAERLRKAIEKTSKAWPYPVTISVGVAYHPKHGDTTNQLLEAAETALRKAKAAGKNRIVIAV
jgi:diguanylate cyclase (GGDEF)-like protein